MEPPGQGGKAAQQVGRRVKAGAEVAGLEADGRAARHLDQVRHHALGAGLFDGAEPSHGHGKLSVENVIERGCAATRPDAHVQARAPERAAPLPPKRRRS